MKKLLLALWAVFYLGVSSGVARTVHFCMGEEAGVSYFRIQDDRCGLCGMKETKNGCCHDEHGFYKLSIDQKLSPAVDIPVFNPVLISITYPAFAVLPSASLNTYQIPFGHAPPWFRTGREHCIDFRVFRL